MGPIMASPYQSEMYVRPYFRVKDGWSSVYVLVAIDNATGASGCKVGMSNDPERRVIDLYRQIGRGIPVSQLPFRIRLLAAFNVPHPGPVEHAAHQILGDHRISGEWFDVSPDDAILAVMEALRQHGKEWVDESSPVLDVEDQE